MADKPSQDVKTTNTTGLADTALGNTTVKAEQNGVTGRGFSGKSGHEGKVEATKNASEEIGAKKAANK